MRVDEKEDEIINWFKDHSSPAQFVESMTMLAIAAASMEIDLTGQDFQKKAQVGGNRVAKMVVSYE